MRDCKSLNEGVVEEEHDGEVRVCVVWIVLVLAGIRVGVQIMLVFATSDSSL